MKFPVLALTCILHLLPNWVSHAQSLPKLEAVSAAATEKMDQLWSTSYGSFKRDYERSRVVDVSVRSFGREPATYQLEAYFLARLPVGPTQRYFWSMGQQNLPIPALGSVKLKVVSPPLRLKDTRYAALGERTFVGGQFEAWLVRLLADGKVIAQVGSSHIIEDLARNPTAFGELQREFNNYVATNTPGFVAPKFVPSTP